MVEVVETSLSATIRLYLSVSDAALIDSDAISALKFALSTLVGGELPKNAEDIHAAIAARLRFDVDLEHLLKAVDSAGIHVRTKQLEFMVIFDISLAVDVADILIIFASDRSFN